MESNLKISTETGYLIIILLFVNFLILLCIVLFKHFSKKNLQEKEFSITFASEKERDRVLAILKRDKEETEELEKQAKNFGLK